MCKDLQSLLLHPLIGPENLWVEVLGIRILVFAVVACCTGCVASCSCLEVRLPMYPLLMRLAVSASGSISGNLLYKSAIITLYIARWASIQTWYSAISRSICCHRAFVSFFPSIRPGKQEVAVVIFVARLVWPYLVVLEGFHILNHCFVPILFTSIINGWG